jgi:competence protein ComEC
LPDTYDFSKNAYFRGIGATGFAVSDVKKIAVSQNTFHESIQQTRNIIAERLVNSVGGIQAEIAKALFIGDIGGIDADSMQAIRNSGLAHLLSISGLHMVIVCAICFKICRFLLALVPRISLNYNTKKLAAICAIIGSYFYLLISGSPVPAERAFIMSTMVFLAILFGRSGTPMRIVVVAALYILITAPENIISPSFQMSFSAVIGLIAAFEYLKPHLSRFASAYKVPIIFMWVFGTIISSIVATIATAPFAIYHFNSNSPYGLLANILAIPMASFVIMPCGILAMVLMPLHLEWLVALPLRKGIDFLMWVANYIAALPYANSAIPGINDWQLLIIVLGLLWLALWKTNIRLMGIGMVMIAMFAAFFNKTPDIIVSSDANLFAVKDENGSLLFSSSKGGSFIKKMWSSRLGQEENLEIEGSGSKIILCDTAACIYKKNGYTITFIKHPIALERDCNNTDIFVNLADINYHCSTALKQINIYNLRKKGVHEIYLGNDIEIKTVLSDRHRIWE